MTAREAQSWEYFGRVCGPYGQKRADWQVAQICQAVLSAADVKKEDGEHFTVEECLLAFEPVFLKTMEEADEDGRRQLVNGLFALASRYR